MGGHEHACVLFIVSRRHSVTETTTVQDILSNWQSAAGTFQKVYPRDYRRALEQMKAEQQQEELLAAHGEGDALAALKAAADAAAKDDAPEHSYLDYLPPAPEVCTPFALLYAMLFDQSCALFKILVSCTSIE